MKNVNERMKLFLLNVIIFFTISLIKFVNNFKNSKEQINMKKKNELFSFFNIFHVALFGFAFFFNCCYTETLDVRLYQL